MPAFAEAKQICKRCTDRCVRCQGKWQREMKRLLRLEEAERQTLEQARVAIVQRGAAWRQ